MKIDIKALKDSNEFLNTLLQNIETAVFIADEHLQIQQFNDSFLTLFSGQTLNQISTGVTNQASGQTCIQDTTIVHTAFGNATGCINAVKENKPCGETSVCQNCSLKKSLLNTLETQKSSEKQSLERIFYFKGKPVKKYLEFSSRPITFHDQKMILFFVYDITTIKLSKLELEEKQKQIDIDLKKAGDIQKSLLPRTLPDVDSIRIDWFFEPSLTVGGDIFHIYKEDETHISAYILDVCGHGISAALIAVTVKQFIDQLHAQGLSQKHFFTPKQMLNALEKEFPFERFDCYLTIVYIRLNLETGKLVYGSAGHVPPVIVGDNNRFEVLGQHGMIIGLAYDPPFEEYETCLNPGERIVLYTDGLIDYFGKRGAVSNTQAFYETLKTNTHKPIDQMVEQIIVRQKELQDGIVAGDDISLLVIEYK
ncbi:MAG: PP2C family protein-serine/threonine phosphatase [Pseudomonadota bacterium]